MPLVRFRLLRQLFDLACSWFRSDRIRCAASEGCLLRLGVGSAVIVRGRPAVVLRRRVGSTGVGPYVAYECDSAAGPCELRVRPIGETHSASVTWTCGKGELALTEADVAVYPRREYRG